MFTNDGYALLIGVDDYSAFDGSRGEAKGTSDLEGSRNDARAFWRLCRRLGMRPANIRVLTSPPIDWAELEGASAESVGPATEAEILAQADWLARNLGRSSRPAGLLTFSGHGDVSPTDGLLLCPSDVVKGKDGALGHAVPFAALNALFGRSGAAESLTVVLDACHSGGAGAGEKAGRQLSLTGRPATEVAEAIASAEDLDARVLSAAGRDQVAYQAVLDGRPRGVFSWALTTAAEQWKVASDGDSTRLDVTYGKLVETAGRLVSALWFDQTPELRGPTGLADVAVFQRGLGARPGETSDRPNAGFRTAELDPGLKDYVLYTITNALGSVVGYVVVTATADSGLNYAANTEYWYLSSNLSNSSSYTLSSGPSENWSSPPSGLGSFSFSTPRTPSWTSGTPSGTMLCYSPGGSVKVCINWGITLSRSVWTGSITWWYSSSSGNLLGPSTSASFTSTTPSSGTWYQFVTTAS